MQFCTFYLGKDLYGIDVLEVQEVIRQQEVTKVPLAPAVIRGLINLRGNIVSTIDMRRLLKMKPLENDEQSINVITRVAGGLVSLLVDQVGDVIEAPEDRFESVPATVRNEAQNIIARVCKLPGNLLMILNPKRIIDFEGSDSKVRARAGDTARHAASTQDAEH